MRTPHKHAEVIKAWADGISARAAKFPMPKIALDITYEPDTGKINDIKLKDWKQ